MIGSGAQVTFPLGSAAFTASEGSFAVVKVLDHPLAHQSAGFDPAGLGQLTQLLDALIG